MQLLDEGRHDGNLSLFDEIPNHKPEFEKQNSFWGKCKHKDVL